MPQALAGKQLCLDVVRLGTVGVQDQHLLHHGLRLVQFARLSCLVNLVHGGLSLGQRRGVQPQTSNCQRQAGKKETEGLP